MPLKLKIYIHLIIALLFTSTISHCSVNKPLTEEPIKKTEIQYFIDLIDTTDKNTIENSITYISNNWKEEYEIMLIELLYFNTKNYELSVKLLAVLRKKNKQRLSIRF